MSYLLHCQRERIDAKTRRQGGPYELDAVITLDYDLVLEKAAAEFEKTSLYYGNGVPEKGNEQRDHEEAWKDVVSKWEHVLPRFDAAVVRRGGAILPVVKLHGSINWCCPPPESGKQGREHNRQESSRVTSVRDPSEVDPSFVPLGPPTWRKQLSQHSIFAKLVDEAIACFEATGEAGFRIKTHGLQQPLGDNKATLHVCRLDFAEASQTTYLENIFDIVAR